MGEACQHVWTWVDDNETEECVRCAAWLGPRSACERNRLLEGRVRELEAEHVRDQLLLGARAGTIAKLRAMLAECIGGRTPDGYDGGIRELTLSAECDKRDGGDLFFANKVRDIHARARALLAETEKTG